MTSNLIRISDHHQSFRIFDSYLSFQRSKNESDVLRPSKHNNNGKYDHASIWVRIAQHLSVCHQKYRHTLFIPSFSSITVDLFCYSPHSTPGFFAKKYQPRERSKTMLSSQIQFCNLLYIPDILKSMCPLVPSEHFDRVTK